MSKGARWAKATPRRASPRDPHLVVFFKRHNSDDPSGTAPGHQFLAGCPTKVEATMYAVLEAVAAAPPMRFAGGGHWEAMHGSMTGWFEVRVDGSKPRVHYRLFCRLDYDAEGADRPLLVVITGMSKPIRTVFSESDYSDIRDLGNEYFARNPRSHL